MNKKLSFAFDFEEATLLFQPSPTKKNNGMKNAFDKHLPARRKGKTKLTTFVNIEIKGVIIIMTMHIAGKFLFTFSDCVAKNQLMLENDT